MKVTLDVDACVGCELCANTCSEVFEMVDDKAKLLVQEVPPEAQESCKEATENCPVEAIVLEE